MCRDEVPFVDPPQLSAAAGSDPGMQEAFGDPPILNVCRGWKVQPAGRVIHGPVRSSVPMLVATGTYDAYSPPTVARRVITSDFPHAFAYDVPGMTCFTHLRLCRSGTPGSSAPHRAPTSARSRIYDLQPSSLRTEREAAPTAYGHPAHLI